MGAGFSVLEKSDYFVVDWAVALLETLLYELDHDLPVLGLLVIIPQNIIHPLQEFHLDLLLELVEVD